MRLLPVVNKRVVGAGAFITLALMLLLLPLQWIAAAFLAGTFHELCHYGAVRLCGGTVIRLRAGVSGARMEIRGLSVFGELVSALAGPLGSLLLLLVARWFPRTALCAGFQGLYNLLPVYPMDGGRVLHCGVALVLPAPMAEKVCTIFGWLCLSGLVILGLYGTFFKGLGLLPLILSVSILVRSKIPCKPGRFSVQ